MLSLFRKLMPREDRFFDLFEHHSRTVVGAAEALRAALAGGPDLQKHCDRIVELEDQADEIAREVLFAVRRSFITPFDRSDIKALSTSLDDAIDQMNKTGKTALLYDVTEFQPNMRAMADGVIALADIVAEALPLMRNIAANSARLHALVGEISRIEEQSDRLNDEGLQQLYRAKTREEALGFIVGSQLYDHLEKCCDRFEDVAHVMGDIVIEHV